jgi:phosphoglycolate phosphatase
MNDIIIWDWNGTLLNDVEVCVEVMNELLEKRGIPLLTVERYRKIFTFPIKEYYKNIGFDFNKDKFEDLAIEFIEIYLASYHKFKLHNDVEDTLKCLEEKGYKQIVLSATNKTNLTEQIELFGMQKYFTEMIGIDDYYGKSKLEHGLEIMSRLSKDQRVILIGDTLHDLEVANALGCECILVANGHQDRTVLESAKVDIVDELKEVLRFL